MDLQRELLELARVIEHEQKWLEQANRLSLDQHSRAEGDRLTKPQQTDLDGMIRKAGRRQQQRSDVIRRAAGDAPRAVAAILYRAATRLDTGGQDTPQLLEQAAAALQDDPPNGIPAEYRTRATSKAVAAKLHSGQTKKNPTAYWDRLIEAGGVTPPMGGGQNWVFDIRDFPDSAHEKLR